MKFVISDETEVFNELQLLYNILQDDDKVETEPAIVLCDVLSELTELITFVDKVDILPLKFVIKVPTDKFKLLTLVYNILTLPAIVLCEDVKLLIDEVRLVSIVLTLPVNVPKLVNNDVELPPVK